MRLPIPQTPIRWVDVAVGAALWLLSLAQLAASPWLVAAQPRMLHLGLYRRIAALLALDLLLWSLACLGVARGRRWGFLLTSILLILAALGPITRLMVSFPRASIADALPLGVGAAALVYGLARFSALRSAPKYPRAFR